MRYLIIENIDGSISLWDAVPEECKEIASFGGMKVIDLQEKKEWMGYEWLPIEPGNMQDMNAYIKEFKAAGCRT